MKNECNEKMKHKRNKLDSQSEYMTEINEIVF